MERRVGGACNHFFKRPVPVYQLLVYPLIGQIWQIISTLSKRVVPVTQKDGVRRPRALNKRIHDKFGVERMCTRFPTHTGALRKEQKPALWTWHMEEIFLQSCRQASVSPDKKSGNNRTVAKGAIYALQSRLTLSLDLFRRIRKNNAKNVQPKILSKHI